MIELDSGAVLVCTYAVVTMISVSALGPVMDKIVKSSDRLTKWLGCK